MKRFFLVCLVGMMAILPAMAQLDSRYLGYISLYKGYAVDQMHRYGIPASITLAQGLLESGAGKGTLARKSNNHFGIKCGSTWTGATVSHDDDAYGECFRSYRSVKDSYEDHSIFLSTKSRYAGLFKLSPTDYRGWAYGLKRAGYATNPVYANSLISLIERYHLYEYDTNNGYKYIYHQIYIANGLPYIIAQRGDSFKSLSKELEIRKGKLIKNNDLYDEYVIQPGDVLYLEKKNKKSAREDQICHIIQPGESLYSISQKYGIRLKNLYKMNRSRVREDVPLVAGEGIRLR